MEIVIDQLWYRFHPQARIQIFTGCLTRKYLVWLEELVRLVQDGSDIAEHYYHKPTPDILCYDGNLQFRYQLYGSRDGSHHPQVFDCLNQETRVFKDTQIVDCRISVNESCHPYENLQTYLQYCQTVFPEGGSIYDDAGGYYAISECEGVAYTIIHSRYQHSHLPLSNIGYGTHYHGDDLDASYKYGCLDSCESPASRIDCIKYHGYGNKVNDYEIIRAVFYHHGRSFFTRKPEVSALIAYNQYEMKDLEESGIFCCVNRFLRDPERYFFHLQSSDLYQLVSEEETYFLVDDEYKKVGDVCDWSLYPRIFMTEKLVDVIPNWVFQEIYCDEDEMAQLVKDTGSYWAEIDGEDYGVWKFVLLSKAKSARK